MSQQGGRPTGHEDDWWGQLYDDSAEDHGPAAAGDSLDDRFASAAGAVCPESAARRPDVGPGAQPGAGPGAGPAAEWGAGPRPAAGSGAGPAVEPGVGPVTGAEAGPAVEPGVGPVTGAEAGPAVGPEGGPVTGPAPAPAWPSVAPPAGPPPPGRRHAPWEPPSATPPGPTTFPPGPLPPGFDQRAAQRPAPSASPGRTPPEPVAEPAPVSAPEPLPAPAPVSAPEPLPAPARVSAPEPEPKPMPETASTPSRPAPPAPTAPPGTHPTRPPAPAQPYAPPAPPHAPTASATGAATPFPPAATGAATPFPPAVTAPRSAPRHAARPAVQPYVGSGPPTYDAEPTALPPADPDALDDVVPDTVLDGARYGVCTLRAASVRGDSARYRGEPRRDALLTARFGTGEQALLLVAMATGARATPGAHRAAAEVCRWIGRAVGRSHVRLAEDIRAGRRGDLKSGLHRLTDRSLGRLRADAAEQGLEPQEYAATLRCLLLPADPACRTRVFFGVGPGGLFRLRDGAWQDIEPRVGEVAGEPVVGFGSPPAETPEGDRLTMDLGIPTPSNPYEPSSGPSSGPAREPFRFRASVARPGDTLLLCTGGLADPLRGEPALLGHLAERWSEAVPPGLAAFLADTQARVKGYADDRTAAAVWEA
ncbi:protein phosphatase 2C domain-containing protein [Streptomyces sp. NPDC088812]|uniref:protein phosphatase 2C domain-containing protein n=1 Tax=Streptomyces sp. NPDC088812 TaxID=3365905 RepID=UPI00380BE5D8